MFNFLKEKLGVFRKKAEEKADLPKKSIEPKREIKADLSVVKKAKSIVTRKISLDEKTLDDLLFDFELSLLEADVEQETAQDLTEKIKISLLGKELSKNEFDLILKQELKTAFKELMKADYFDLIEKAKSKKPFKILFLGPNGAGKTTTIAKLAFLFKKNNLIPILAAGDTFRAASLEQLQEHADRLDVKLIKHKYGSDPTAVAFDAVKSAEANNLDVVLIDSAGRQETNKNLMKELEKISRIIKPDLTIFVGESLAGKNLLDQAKEFNKIITLDGFILTKIDADPKGGTTVSLIHSLKKPVLYIGTGQNYENLQKFTPEFIIDRII